MVTSDARCPWPPAGLGHNALRLARALCAEGPSTRLRLGELTGFSRPTITAGLGELKKRGLIETETDRGGQGQTIGRPARLIRLSRRAGLTVGIEIGRRHIQVVLTDLGHQLIDRAPAEADAYRHPPTADADPDEVLDKTAEMVRTLLARNNCRLAEVTAIGLGIPVPITREGRIGAPALAPRWADVDPAEALTKRLDNVPVLVDNNANLGALGEYTFGGFHRDRPTGRSYEMIYVKLAAGIGAGIIRDGQLHRGASGTAGELGHITLDPKDPTKCLCGNQGCLELYAGEEVLLKKARIAWPDLSDTLELVDRAKAGDHYCISVIQDVGDYAGLALGILVNLTGPDLILIGGELSDADGILLGPIRQKVDRTAMPEAARAATISTAPLRKWSSAWGAAALALTTTADETAAPG